MTTMMTSLVAAPIAMIFSFNGDLVLRALEGLTQDELWKAPTDRNNAMLWVAGHVVQTRAMVLQLLGEPADPGWGKLFDRSAPAPTIGEVNRYPSRKDIERVMRDVSLRLPAKLASLSNEYLAGLDTRALCECRPFVRRDRNRGGQQGLRAKRKRRMRTTTTDRAD